MGTLLHCRWWTGVCTESPCIRVYGADANEPGRPTKNPFRTSIFLAWLREVNRGRVTYLTERNVGLCGRLPPRVPLAGQTAAAESSIGQKERGGNQRTLWRPITDSGRDTHGTARLFTRNRYRHVAEPEQAQYL